jgi:two-component system nitrogen regulation sensor histidine kinase GlnL
MSLDDAGRELTDLIVAESRRIVTLLDQVEQFGDIRPPAQREVNLHDVLARAKASAEVGFARTMRIAEYYDPSLPAARGDGDQLLQVVLNLIRNAAEAVGETGGTITLRSQYDRGMRVRDADGRVISVPLQIEVEDDGPGLPEDIADEVFDPFVSGRENGTGLGLALAVKIVAAHGGLIGVRSQPGRTVFRISLPVASQGAKEAA